MEFSLIIWVTLIVCVTIYKCKKLDKEDYENLILKNKYKKLKSLILLTDSTVSNIEMNELSVKQWSEFVKEFPEEGEELKNNRKNNEVSCTCGKEYCKIHGTERGF